MSDVQITEYGGDNEYLNPWMGEERVVIVQGVNGRRPMIVDDNATHEEIRALYLTKYKRAGGSDG